VLQVSDKHEVIVGDHEWKKVEECDGTKAKDVDAVRDESADTEKRGIGLHNQPVVLLIKKRGRRTEMVNILATVLGGSCRIENQVSRHPPYREHEKDANELGERCFSQHVIFPIIARGRSKDFIVLA
jgi:hypothetical protein